MTCEEWRWRIMVALLVCVVLLVVITPVVMAARKEDGGVQASEPVETEGMMAA
jgi:uncharacterized protein YpmS